MFFYLDTNQKKKVLSSLFLSSCHSSGHIYALAVLFVSLYPWERKKENGIECILKPPSHGRGERKKERCNGLWGIQKMDLFLLLWKTLQCEYRASPKYCVLPSKKIHGIFFPISKMGQFAVVE